MKFVTTLTITALLAGMTMQAGQDATQQPGQTTTAPSSTLGHARTDNMPVVTYDGNGGPEGLTAPTPVHHSHKKAYIILIVAGAAGAGILFGTMGHRSSSPAANTTTGLSIGGPNYANR